MLLLMVTIQLLQSVNDEAIGRWKVVEELQSQFPTVENQKSSLYYKRPSVGSGDAPKFLISKHV